MKKIAFMLLMIFAVASISYAQEVEKKDKVKRTTNISDKAHNTFSKHKHYNGYKVKKTRDVNGHLVKEKTKVKTD